MAVAERVSEERADSLGRIVGYQIRLEKMQVKFKFNSLHPGYFFRLCCCLATFVKIDFFGEGDPVAPNIYNGPSCLNCINLLGKFHWSKRG